MRYFRLLALLLTYSAALIQWSVHAQVISRTKLGKPLTLWGDGDVYLAPGGPAFVESSLKAAIDRWNKALKRTRFRYAGKCTIKPWETTQKCVYWVTGNWAHYDNSPFATATTRTYFLEDFGEIFHFHIFLNAEKHDFAERPMLNKSVLSDTLTHELGHALGLGHQLIHPDSVMVSTVLYSGNTDRSPSADDIAAVTEGKDVSDFDRIDSPSKQGQIRDPAVREFVTGMKNMGKDAAEPSFKACKRFPNYDCNVQRAVNFNQLGKYNEALKLIDASPLQQDLELKREKSLALLKLGRREEALHEFKDLESNLPIPHRYIVESLELDPRLDRVPRRWRLYPATLGVRVSSGSAIKLTPDLSKLGDSYRKKILTVDAALTPIRRWRQSQENRGLYSSLLAWARARGLAEVVNFAQTKLKKAKVENLAAADIANLRRNLASMASLKDKVQLCSLSQVYSDKSTESSECKETSLLDSAESILADPFLL